MREIKFRAWDDGNMYYFAVYWIDKYSEDTIIMQYTGLKDRSGKEIYEGDIVEIECECGHRDKMPVEWGYNGYRLKQIWSHRFPSGELELQQLNRTEVIGNIYESPQLLEIT